MIFTELYEGQGLGNQLWVYAASRSVAERLNAPFVLIGAERFKGAGFLHIASRIGVSAEEAALALRRGVREFQEEVFFDPELDYLSSGFDSRVLFLREPTKLDGLMQSERYFFGDLDKLRDYLPLDPAWASKTRVPEDVCVINLRGGEYKRHKRLVLPDYYWKMGIDNMRKLCGIEKYLVVTDDIPYGRAMFPGCEVLQGSVGDCYAAVYNARYLILSNSSFAYFPTRTGANKRMVIAPMYWARFANVLGRWASVCNVYKDWTWQDSQGKLHDYESCLRVADETEAYYRREYRVRTRLDVVQRPKVKDLLPRGLRRSVKVLLSRIVPKHFG